MCIVNDISITSRKTFLMVTKIEMPKKQTDSHTITKSTILIDKWYRQQSCNLMKIEQAKKVLHVYDANKDTVFPTTGKSVIDSETVKVILYELFNILLY